MPNELQTKILDDASLKAKLGYKRHRRLLKHAAAFSEHQFGKRISGTSFYRTGSESLSNFDQEVNTLCAIYLMIGKCDTFCNALSANGYNIANV
jgi:hypothetical protein